MRSLHFWPTFPFNLDPPVARSLSIQFILHELIDSFEVLEDLQTSTPLQLRGVNPKEAVASISKDLETFLLFSLENPLGYKSSALDKLCFYCAILLQASPISDHEISLILDEMRDSILEVKNTIAWKKARAQRPIGQILADLAHLYASLFQKLRRFFKALSPFLKEARSDENVLISLIENKDKLNAHLGPRRIEELLISFFPAGHDQLRAAILEGYTRRGFTTFLAKVEPLIDAIEWETPCHPATTR